MTHHSHSGASHQKEQPRAPFAGRTYGMLVGKIKDGQEFEGGHDPHYEIWVAADHDYRIAVNVRSEDGSEVFAHYDPKYLSPSAKLNLEVLAQGTPGFSPVKTGSGGDGLDYLRDNLFPTDQMIQIPPEGQGVTLSNLLDAQIERAKADGGAVVIAFGESFQDSGSDATFHFSPERGVHDIHMMQGNAGRFASDNRINGDGALFIRFGDGETLALFVRFETQALNTDDQGNPVNRP